MTGGSSTERASPRSLSERSESKGRRPDAKCPLRPGEPCTMCQYDVSGPHDCPLVYLVMDDPELREAWVESRKH